MPAPATIDEVLAELDNIVDITIEEDCSLGIFAFVYRRTTAGIAEGINNGRFEDGGRMEQFDVHFALRYLKAFWHYRESKPVSYAWKKAFNAANGSEKNGDPIIMQQLLLGMNAHINLDLGISAAAIAPGDSIESLRNDFMTVNLLLAELVDEIQERIARISPMMFLLDWIGKNNDEAVVNFSMEKARSFAWNFARILAYADDDQQCNRIISRVDKQVTNLGSIVAEPPGFLLPRFIRLIRRFEEKDTRTVIEMLRV